MKKFLLLTFLCSIVLFSFQDVSNVSATTNDADLSYDVKEMRERYQELGISEEDGEILIQKILDGELLDSQKTDIPKDNLTTIIDDDGSETIVYPDGSRAKVAFESDNISPLIQPFGASTGTATLSCKSGTICDVVVRYYDMIWDIKYDAKVNIFNGGNPGIISISNFRSDVVLYNIQDLGGTIIRYNAATSLPAKARWKFKAQHKTGIYQITRDLSLYVDKNSVVYARLEWD